MSCNFEKNEVIRILLDNMEKLSNKNVGNDFIELGRKQMYVEKSTPLI